MKPSCPILADQIGRFGSRLKEVIGQESLRSFARKIGLSEASVRNYVGGKRYPGLDTLGEIAARAKVNFMWLATGEGPQQGQEDKKDQQVIRPVLDIKTLRLAIETVEQAFSEKGVTMDPDKKAELVAAIYEWYSESGSLEKTPVLRLIKTMT